MSVIDDLYSIVRDLHDISHDLYNFESEGKSSKEIEDELKVLSEKVDELIKQLK